MDEINLKILNQESWSKTIMEICSKPQSKRLPDQKLEAHSVAYLEGAPQIKLKMIIFKVDKRFTTFAFNHKRALN